MWVDWKVQCMYCWVLVGGGDADLCDEWIVLWRWLRSNCVMWNCLDWVCELHQWWIHVSCVYYGIFSWICYRYLHRLRDNRNRMHSMYINIMPKLLITLNSNKSNLMFFTSPSTTYPIIPNSMRRITLFLMSTIRPSSMQSMCLNIIHFNHNKHMHSRLWWWHNLITILAVRWQQQLKQWWLCIELLVYLAWIYL